MGLGFVLLLMIAGNAGVYPSVVQSLLLPGLVVASALKFGAHDLATVAVVLVVDSAVYGVAAFLISALIKPSNRASQAHNRPR